MSEDNDIDNGYTYEEKLRMVAEGGMDPKEIGMTTAEEAHLELMPAPEKPNKLGSSAMFQVGSVPIELRVEWAEITAKAENKILPFVFDREAWVAEHKHEFLIQGRLDCGTARLMFQQSCNDEMLGICAAMHTAADLLEAKYKEGATTPTEVKTDEAVAQS